MIVKIYPVVDDNYKYNASKETKAIYHAIPRKIGASMGKNGEPVLTGLTLEEKNLIMPSLVNATPETHNFYPLVAAYFNDMSREVPLYEKGGLTLNTYLMYPELPLSKDNLPVSPADYVLYKYCLAYSKCAKNKEEAQGDSKGKWFYFHDETKELNRKAALADKVMEATVKYASIETDVVLIDAALTVLFAEETTNTNPNYLSKEERKIFIMSEVLANHPVEFLDAINRKDIQATANVHKLVNAGIIERSGKVYHFSGEELGNSVDDVIIYLRQSENSKTQTILKAKLQELITG